MGGSGPRSVDERQLAGDTQGLPEDTFKIRNLPREHSSFGGRFRCKTVAGAVKTRDRRGSDVFFKCAATIRGKYSVHTPDRGTRWFYFGGIERVPAQRLLRLAVVSLTDRRSLKLQRLAAKTTLPQPLLDDDCSLSMGPTSSHCAFFGSDASLERRIRGLCESRAPVGR